MPAPNFDLYLITDPAMPRGLIGSVEAALSQGVPKDRVAVQLRAKTLSASELIEVGRILRAVTEQAGAALLVNGPWQLASAIGADGVQVPEGNFSLADIRRHLGPNALLGRSCHHLAGVMECATEADFVTLSPYYSVPGKAQPLSAETAGEICRAAHLPIFALGGIAKEQVSAALVSGARGIAVIRSVFAHRDPARSLHDLLLELDASRALLSTHHWKGRG